jgi:hypothetical protein
VKVVDHSGNGNDALVNTQGGEPNHRYFQGAVDEIRVSDIARTPDEIKESFTSGLKLPVEPKGKLTGMWGNVKL